MSSFNRVILLGAAGRDAELRYSADGAAIANVSLATARRYKDSSGNLQEETEWHRLSLFGRLAEVAGEYVKKGKQILVEGRLRTRKWQDSDGIDRYTTEIVVDHLQLLGGGRTEAASAETAVASAPEPARRPAARSTATAAPATARAPAGTPAAATRGRTPGGRLARDKTGLGTAAQSVATATTAALAAAAPGDLARMSDDIPF